MISGVLISTSSSSSGPSTSGTSGRRGGILMMIGSGGGLSGGLRAGSGIIRLRVLHARLQADAATGRYPTR
jgi:hypothetical protein